MDERYLTPAMRALWGRDQHIKQLHAAATVAADHSDDTGELRKALRDIEAPSVADVAELEAEYGHDVAAYLELVRVQLEEPLAAVFHRGLTSSDLVDTALGFTLQVSSDTINHALETALTHCARYAWTWRGTPILARTHGRTGERTSLGRRWAVLAFALYNSGIEPYRLGHLSGPAGTNTNGEDELLSQIALLPVPAGQCVPRVYLYNWATQLAVVATAAEAIATEIRLGCQTGIEIYREGREPGYRGSSSMPHKVNPTRSERICGLARVVRANVGALGESCALWNERDISHSSVERTALADAVCLTHYILVELADVMRGLQTLDYNAVAGVSDFTSAEALEAMVDSGVPHATAYREIQQFGFPSTALAYRHIDAERYRQYYDPKSEPKLWEWVEAYYEGEFDEGLDKEASPMV